MTLLDAPEFDAARSKRNRLIAQLSAGALVVLFIVGWLVCGRPVDWPWNWSRYVFGRAAVNNFLGALEANDLQKAYGVWEHDKNWQQHPAQYSTYPFSALSGRLGPDEPGQRIWSHSQPQDCTGRPLRQRLAGGRADQRPQERRAEPGLRSQDRAVELCAAGRELVSGTVGQRVSRSASQRGEDHGPLLLIF